LQGVLQELMSAVENMNVSNGGVSFTYPVHEPISPKPVLKERQPFRDSPARVTGNEALKLAEQRREVSDAHKRAHTSLAAAY
jgi:hypothetical protein